MSTKYSAPAIPRDSSRPATRRTSPHRLQTAFVGLFCVVCSGACKSRDPAPTPPSHAAPAAAEIRAAPQVEPSKFQLPPEHTFELPDDVGSDPAEALREMRHNCCDEMPASEVEAAVRAGEATEATARTPHQQRNAGVRQSRKATGSR